MNVGDRMRLRQIDTVEVVEVVVLQVLGAVAIVEDTVGPKPRRQWMTGGGYLALDQILPKRIRVKSEL